MSNREGRVYNSGLYDSKGGRQRLGSNEAADMLFNRQAAYPAKSSAADAQYGVPQDENMNIEAELAAVLQREMVPEKSPVARTADKWLDDQSESMNQMPPELEALHEDFFGKSVDTHDAQHSVSSAKKIQNIQHSENSAEAMTLEKIYPPKDTFNAHQQGNAGSAVSCQPSVQQAHMPSGFGNTQPYQGQTPAAYAGNRTFVPQDGATGYQTQGKQQCSQPVQAGYPQGQQGGFVSPFAMQQSSQPVQAGYPQGQQDLYYGQPMQENPEYSYAKLVRPQSNGNIQGTTVISVYSPKGGAGKSSVCKELACTFIRDDASIGGRKPHVLIVDMDLSYADLHVMFNVSASPNISGWAQIMRKDMARLGYIPAYDKRTIDRFIKKNVRDGLDFLAGPPNKMERELITPEIADAICKNLRACDYDIIVFDNAPSHKEPTLRIVEQSDKVLVIATLDTTTCNEMGEFFDIERERSFDATKFKLVVNKVPTNTRRLDIQPEQIFNLYNVEAVGTLPEDDTVRCANNDASSIVLDEKDTQFAREMRNIANSLVPVFRPEKKGIFAKLFGKKK